MRNLDMDLIEGEFSIVPFDLIAEGFILLGGMVGNVVEVELLFILLRGYMKIC
jgi:hypothetical protein